MIALESGAEEAGHRKSLYISIAFVLVFFIALTVWGVHEDLGRGTFTVGQLVLSYSFTLIGAAIGIGALVGIVLARRQIHRLQKWDPITTVMITSMGLSVLTILLTPESTRHALVTKMCEEDLPTKLGAEIAAL